VAVQREDDVRLRGIDRRRRVGVADGRADALEARAGTLDLPRIDCCVLYCAALRWAGRAWRQPRAVGDHWYGGLGLCHICAGTELAAATYARGLG
jgi:hypothetical protein